MGGGGNINSIGAKRKKKNPACEWNEGSSEPLLAINSLWGEPASKKGRRTGEWRRSRGKKRIVRKDYVLLKDGFPPDIYERKGEPAPPGEKHLCSRVSKLCKRRQMTKGADEECGTGEDPVTVTCLMWG